MIFSSVLLVTALNLISSTESFTPRYNVGDRSATFDTKDKTFFSRVERAGPLYVSLTQSIVGAQSQETTVAAVPKVRR